MSRITPEIRALVRERAASRCEYCHKPDAFGTYGYHVDHIVPLVHGGTSDSDNLAWACFECNVAKGRDIASYDRLTGLLTPLFHPRHDHWQDHFEFDGPTLIAKTAIGRVTISVLRLNHPDLIETRMLLMEAGRWIE